MVDVYCTEIKVDARHPDLFQSQQANEIPASLTTPSLFAIVNSCATLYHTSASRLASIQDIPIPSTNASSALIGLGGQLKRVAVLQAAQSAQIADLRCRSVAVVERWYQLCILSGAKCWAEWEKRVGTVEQDVRRQELARAREEIIS